MIVVHVFTSSTLIVLLTWGIWLVTGWVSKDIKAKIIIIAMAIALFNFIAVIAVEMIKKLLTLNNLEIVAVDSLTFFEALKRAAKYKLKINDMIHYTIALLRNASGIYSYDKDFNGFEIERVEP